MFLSVTCKNKIAKIYKKPSVQSELISQVLFGEKFIIKKKINKFYKGYSSYDRYPGYVLMDDFVKDKEKKNYRVKIKKAFLYDTSNNKILKKSLLFNSKCTTIVLQKALSCCTWQSLIFKTVSSNYA